MTREFREIPFPFPSILAQAFLVRVSWYAVGPANWVLAGAGRRPEHDVKLLPQHALMMWSCVAATACRLLAVVMSVSIHRPIWTRSTPSTSCV